MLVIRWMLWMPIVLVGAAGMVWVSHILHDDWWHAVPKMAYGTAASVLCVSLATGGILGFLYWLIKELKD